MSLINNQYIQNQIKNYFKDKNINIVQNRSDTFLKEHQQIKKYLQQFLINHKQWETIKHLIYGIVFNIQLPLCKHCNTIIPFSKRKAKYCSRICCNSDIEFLENKKKIIYDRYGCENVQQIAQIKQKTRKTYLLLKQNNQNYYKERNEKRKKTIIQKYQTIDNYNKLTLQKRKLTTLSQFGCEHIFQRNDVKQKIINRHINDYGSLQQFYKKRNNNNTNHKYFLHQGWLKIINKWKEYIIPMFSQQQYKGGQKTGNIYKWKCTICGNQFDSEIYCTGHLRQVDILLPRCLKCFPKNQMTSKKELQLLNFCKQFFTDAKKSRTLIKPLEVDVLIPQIKLCLQFNGSFYHTIEKCNKQHDHYHLYKTNLCNEKGYRLIHIWQDQWDNNKQYIKQKLKNIFLNNENLNYIDNEIILDRSWHNNININGYTLVQELKPEIIIRDNLNVQNCGYLKYMKSNLIEQDKINESK